MQEQCVCAQEKSAETKEKAADGTAADYKNYLHHDVTRDCNRAQQEKHVRVPLSRKTRFEIFKRDSFKCQYCGKSAPDVVLEVDHINPVAAGGTNEIWNLISACDTCNRGKSDRQLSDHATVLKSKRQLDELQSRREQLEMLMEWKTSLCHERESTSQFVAGFVKRVAGVELQREQLDLLDRAVAKAGLDVVTQVIEEHAPTLRAERQRVPATVAHISAVSVVRSRGTLDHDRGKMLYARGIVRNRLAQQGPNLYFSSEKCLELIESAYWGGVDVQAIISECKRVNYWQDFAARLFRLESQAERRVTGGR